MIVNLMINVLAMAMALVPPALVPPALVPVNLALEQGPCIEREVYVEVVATSDGRLTQRVAAVSVVLEWPSERLSFLRLEAVAGLSPDQEPIGVDWMVAGFLPDPDGINDDLDDGISILTLLSPPDDPAIIQTRCGTVLATLVFELADKKDTPTVQIVGTTGEYGQTAVYLFDVVGGDVSGSLTGVRISCSRRKARGR